MTIKQRQFFKVYQETRNATEAAWQSYKCKDRLSARNIGSKLLSNVGIKDEIKFWLEEEGLTNGQLAKDIKTLKTTDDWRALAKGIEIELKLKGLDEKKVDLTSGGKPITLLGGDSGKIQKDNSDREDTKTKE